MPCDDTFWGYLNGSNFVSIVLCISPLDNNVLVNLVDDDNYSTLSNYETTCMYCIRQNYHGFLIICGFYDILVEKHF